MAIHRRITVALGLALAIAGTCAASAFGAATLRLETRELGNLKGAEFIGKGVFGAEAGTTTFECTSFETAGEVTTNEAAKDLATAEVVSSCGILSGISKMEMTGKGKASISAAKGKKLAFKLVVSPTEECVWQATSLKGLIVELDPLEIFVKGKITRDTKLSSPECAKTGGVELALVMYAAEPPFRLYEEPVVGKILG